MKRLFFTLLKVGISLCLVIFFLRQVGWPQLQAAMASARVEHWAIAVALFCVSNLLGAFQWRELLSVQEIRLPIRTILTLYLVGVFFNNFLISNIDGDAIRIYDLNRLTGKGLGGVCGHLSGSVYRALDFDLFRDFCLLCWWEPAKPRP